MQCEKYAGRETVNVLKEIVLPGSHVAAWCEQLVKETAPLAAAIEPLWKSRSTGDPSGGSTHANSGASSWAVFANTMKKYEEYKPVYRYARKDPGVTARVNAVNGMLCSSADRNPKRPAVLHRSLVYRVDRRLRRGEVESRCTRRHI